MITFDTNILIYAAHPRAPAKQRIALDLLLAAESGVLVWQVACEFIAASRKLAPHGFTRAEAWDQLTHHLRSFPLILPTPAILERARSFHVEQQWSFWDAMIVQAALHAGCTRLLSEDFQDGRMFGTLLVENPFSAARS